MKYLMFYEYELKEIEEMKNVDAVILAVPHEEYKGLNLESISLFYNENYVHIMAMELQMIKRF